MPLLDLPPELLTTIADYIGASELRKSVAYLLVAKRWYHVVLPVYLSQLPLSTIYLTSHQDLERLPSPNTTLSSLIQAKAKRLSVRLVGHPSKRPSVAPWHGNTDLDELALFGYDGTKRWKTWHCAWMTAGPVEHIVEGRTRWHWHREERILHQWRDRINEKLVELATLLPSFEGLEELSLEASSEEDGEQGPRWDYLHDYTIRSLISSLPYSLNNLTLDLCGSRAITPDRSRRSVHLCPLIAERLHNFQNVRLRLRCICPQVLEHSLLPNAVSRLKTLVIRLSLPFFPEAIDEAHNGYDEFDAKSCVETAIPLHKRMIAAGADFTTNFPGLSMMRISYRSQSDTDDRSSYLLAVADCVRKRYMYEPSEMLCSEDDGSRWKAWEDNKTLQDGRIFEELLW